MASYSSNHLRLLSFTKLLTSHVNNGRHEEALSLFRHIHASLPISGDPFVFPLALKACSSTRRHQMGAAVHALTSKWGFMGNPFVGSALVDMYGKCVSVLYARKAFDEMPDRNAVVWNSMISSYARSGNVAEAMELFRVMDVRPSASSFNSIMAALLNMDTATDMDDGFSRVVGFFKRMLEMRITPNLITVLALLRASLSMAELSLIKEIHGYSVRIGIEANMQLESGLVEAYGRCGSLESAKTVFNRMNERDVVSWSSLISVFALQGDAENAFATFAEMEMASVKPDGITFLAVLKACSHSGLADEARAYFDHMQKIHGLAAGSDHYACLVDVLSRSGRLSEAYEVIRTMPVKVTVKAWGALLAACRSYGEVEIGEIAGRALLELEPENPANYVILGRLLASSGRPKEAQELRIEMRDRGLRTSPGSSWTMHQK